MTITASNSKPLQANQQVNRIGRYIYKHLDGAFRYNISSNTFDIYTTLLYQLPPLMQVPGKGKAYNDVHKLTINISITTYSNKIRVNTIEMTPAEKTLGYDLFEPEIAKNLENAKNLILNRVKYRISSAYKNYNILF